MILALSQLRNRTEPMRMKIRRDLVIPPSHTRRTILRTHPVRLAQRQRDYRRVVTGAALHNHFRPDEIIDLVEPPAPRPQVRPVIEGVNYPAPGETWDDVNDYRARYGMSPMDPAARRKLSVD